MVVMALAAAVSAQPRTLALVGGTVVNTDGSEPIGRSVILIEGDRIKQVGLLDEIGVPDDAEIIRTAGQWIIPGLIDAHIHFFQSGGLYTRPDVIDLRSTVPYPDEIARIDRGLNALFARYLRLGITGVCDVGGPFWNFQVRDRARAADAAPRIAITGPLISTYQPAALTTDDPPILKVNTPEEARALVAKQAEHRPDFIKIWFIVRRGETPADHLPIIQAVVDESHRRDLRVIIHATELETARAAVQAGVDVLVHSVFDKEVDDAFLALLKKRDVIYCPTLMVMGRYSEVLSQQLRLSTEEFELGDPRITSSLFDLRQIPMDNIPERRRGLLEKPPPLTEPTVALHNLKKVHDAGIPIAMGTDAGNIGTLHGASIHPEMALMQRAGLSPQAILHSATVGGARVMGRAHELGTIQPGMLADLVVLAGDPLQDIRNLARVQLVVKNGRVFRPQTLVPDTAEDVVQRQVNAYNARDLEAFVSFFSPDVEFFDLGDPKPSLSGRNDLRLRYRTFFAKVPKLHCQITSRIVQGNRVIDHEKVTGLPDGRVLRAVAIYEVALDKIRRVWFIR